LQSRSSDEENCKISEAKKKSKKDKKSKSKSRSLRNQQNDVIQPRVAIEEEGKSSEDE